MVRELIGHQREDGSFGSYGDGGLAEYYEPATGESLGSLYQSWTAAAAIDLRLAPGWRT